MKARLLGAVLIGVVALAVFWTRRAPERTVDSPPGTPAEPDGTVAAASLSETESLSAAAASPASGSLGLGPVSSRAPVVSAEVELDPVRTLIRDYRLAQRGNPVGNNAEITAALRAAKLLPAPGFVLNTAGELVDRWGTPYFFHQISGEKMEIRSAGADQRLWSADDLVVP